VHPRTEVTIDSLYQVVYKKSIGTKMNDLDFCLEVVQGHVNHDGINISKSQKLQIWYTTLCGEYQVGAQIIFPISGHDLGHVTLQLLAYDRTYLQNYLSYWLQIWQAALTYHCYLTVVFCIL